MVLLVVKWRYANPDCISAEVQEKRAHSDRCALAYVWCASARRPAGKNISQDLNKRAETKPTAQTTRVHANEKPRFYPGLFNYLYDT